MVLLFEHMGRLLMQKKYKKYISRKGQMKADWVGEKKILLPNGQQPSFSPA